MALLSQTQRTLLLSFIALIIFCGLVGICGLELGSDRDKDYRRLRPNIALAGRVLLTTAAVGAASILALTSAIPWKHRRWHPIGLCGLVGIALLLVLGGIWWDPFHSEQIWPTELKYSWQPMASLGFIIILILFSKITFQIWSDSSAIEDDVQQKPAPKGIAGWLIIPAINLVFAPIKTVVMFFLSLRVLQIVQPELINDPRCWFLGLIDLGMTIAVIIVAVLFFRRRHMAVRAYIALMLASIIAALVQSLIQVDMFDSFDVGINQGVIPSCIHSAIWIPYFLKSKRVKNTFTT